MPSSLLPPRDMPRERLHAWGVENLKDYELVALMLATGYKHKDVRALAQEILGVYPKEQFAKVSCAELSRIKGIGIAKAAALVASIEFARRVLEHTRKTVCAVDTIDRIVALTRDIATKRKEHFVVLYLNARNHLIKKGLISIGTVNANIVHPREVFYPAIKYLASSLILVHNHPSGDPAPSKEDVTLTKQLTAAGNILGIEVLDHVIVCEAQVFSFRAHAIF